MTESFASLAAAQGLKWAPHYVDWVWERRESLTAYLPPLERTPVLEFGCNVGATAIVLARLGAKVTGVDVDARKIPLARANAAEHGENATFLHVPDTRSLPFPTGYFEVVTCASVLEYVKPDHLPGVLQEIDRVLAPGGALLIRGTSSRLSPREVHSGLWSNWLPRWIKPGWQRGVWPWRVRIKGYLDLAYEDRDRSYLKARGAGPMLKALASLAHLTGAPLGYFSPSVYLALKKRLTP